MKNSTDKITMVIDKDVLNKYTEYYFSKHPKAKKEPIKNPSHPSINTWMTMRRPQMNACKQKYKEFTKWFVEYCGYSNACIEKCEMLFTTYFPTRSRHDTDNTVPKMTLDGMVDAGLIVDDDSKHLTSLTLRCEYDKEHPRTEIIVKICE